MKINYFIAAATGLYIGGCGYAIYNNNLRLAAIYLCYAVANAVLSTMG